MNTKIPLLFALVFAVVAIYGIVQYLNAQKVVKDNVTIIVAKWDISEGDTITRDMLGTKSVGRAGYIPSAMIRSGEEATYIGYRSMMSFTRDDPIIKSGLTIERRKKEPLAPLIDPGLRAVSLPINMVNSVTNLVEPGDHVDILVTFEVPKVEEKDVNLSDVQGVGQISVPTNVETTEPATVYLLQDVTILATGQEIVGKEIAREFADEWELGYDAVTIAVTPEEAPILAFARVTAGQQAFTLLLRNPKDGDILEDVEITNYKTVLDKINLSDIMKARHRRRVEVLYGGQAQRQP